MNYKTNLKQLEWYLSTAELCDYRYGPWFEYRRNFDVFAAVLKSGNVREVARQFHIHRQQVYLICARADNYIYKRYASVIKEQRREKRREFDRRRDLIICATSRTII